MRAKFDGGPLDGREIDLPGEQPAIEVHASAGADVAAARVEITGEFARITMGGPPRTRYALHFTRRGVAHYYIPTGEQ